MLHSLKNTWFFNTRGDVLAGLVVALALIPEAIAFSIIAGVDPKVGLYASFCIAVVIAFVGGRPGMVSAATGAIRMKGISCAITIWVRFIEPDSIAGINSARIIGTSYDTSSATARKPPSSAYCAITLTPMASTSETLTATAISTWPRP